MANAQGVISVCVLFLTNYLDFLVGRETILSTLCLAVYVCLSLKSSNTDICLTVFAFSLNSTV